MKIGEPILTWDNEQKIAKCDIPVITEYPITIQGFAHCCPEDYDMCNEKTGCFIAYQRAAINVYKYYKTYFIKPKLDILKQLYYSMNRSKDFNEKSYENKMLQRQIRLLQNELDTANDLLDERKEQLNEYLLDKEKFYQKVRSFRRVQEEEAKHKAENK